MQKKFTNVNVKAPIKQGGTPLLPNERDETSDQHAIKPRKKMKQALIDLEKGQVDTDMHGQRGVEQVVQPPTKHQKNK